MRMRRFHILKNKLLDLSELEVDGVVTVDASSEVDSERIDE